MALGYKSQSRFVYSLNSIIIYCFSLPVQTYPLNSFAQDR